MEKSTWLGLMIAFQLVCPTSMNADSAEKWTEISARLIRDHVEQCSGWKIATDPDLLGHELASNIARFTKESQVDSCKWKVPDDQQPTLASIREKYNSGTNEGERGFLMQNSSYWLRTFPDF